jgi:phage terminase small subunit
MAWLAAWCPESRILEARLLLFARRMADCENAAKAARLAGYSYYPGTSRATGSRLMQDPAVVAMVEVERRERAQRLRVSEGQLVEAYTAIAFGDFRSVVRYHNGKVEITPSDDLTEDEVLLIASIETHTRTDKAGNVTVTTTIKLQDRQRALEALARIKGVFRDRVEVEYANRGVADEMAELRQRRRALLAASDAEEGARRHLQEAAQPTHSKHSVDQA